MIATASVADAFEFVRNGKSIKQDKSSGGLPVTRIETIADWRIDGSRVGYAALEEQGNEKWLLKPGDILFSHINSVEHVGKCALYEGVPSKLIHGMNLLALRPKAEILDPRYAYRALSYSGFRANLQQFINKAVNQASISTANLKSLDIPLPPLDEQRRIAAILDKADALHRKRKRALDLLDSLTQSIFLEMFGTASAGRDMHRKPIHAVCEVSSGSTPKREDTSNFGGDIPWVKTTEVRGAVIRSTEETVTEKGAKSARLRIYPKNTVLIAMYGQGTTRGKAGILGIDAAVNQACAAIIAGPELHPVFLFHHLKQNYNELRNLGRGGNQPNLNGELVRDFEIVVPPRKEQAEFVTLIEKISISAESTKSSSDNLDVAFSSLQHRAFSGQL